MWLLTYAHNYIIINHGHISITDGSKKFMIIAIATDGGYVSPHFGRCQEYTLVDIVDGNVKEKNIVGNPGHSPGTIPQFLNENGVKRIVCGGMGSRAMELFEKYNIEMQTGVEGKIEDIIKDIAQGILIGGASPCTPGAGRGYGIEKTECDHVNEES